MTAKPLVFISHVNEEAAVAGFLQDRLSGMFLGGVNFFVSSDRRSLRGGDHWLNSIGEALSTCSVVLCVLSPGSIERAWVNFEAGAGWFQKRVIPVCHSGLKPSHLPQPLQSLVGYDLHDPLDLRELSAVIGEAAGLLSPNADWDLMARSLSEVVATIAQRPHQPFGASPCAVFASSEDIGTIGSLERSLRECQTIAMYSIGLNFFWNASHLRVFEERLRLGQCTARVCMANFKSDSILGRLDDEPEHPIGVAGAEHLLRRLVRMENAFEDSDRLAVRVFEHYPTYAMLAFDDELYIYMYGYKTLGNSSPTFYWWGKDPAAKFYRDQFEVIWDDAQPARLLYGTP